MVAIFAHRQRLQDIRTERKSSLGSKFITRHSHCTTTICIRLISNETDDTVAHGRCASATVSIWFQNWGVVGLELGVVSPRSSTDGGPSTGLRYRPGNFYLIYTNLSFYEKS